MSSQDPPKFIYKILPQPPPEPLPHRLPLSELDQKDGFVHLSTAEQVPKTCDLFFSDTADLWVLKVEFASMESRIKWENGFPHLYGNFGAEEVVSSHNFQRAGTQQWSESMKGLPELE